MQTLTYGLFVYEVDHAVKGADYIHGYDRAGNLVVAFEGVTDFENFEYTGTYMVPDECLEEQCNTVKHVNGKFVRQDGKVISGNNAYTEDEQGNMYTNSNLSVGGAFILSPDSYGDTLPERGEVGQLFFLRYKEDD